jgi:DNA (cytosine-5)-methyltransferase 1
MSFEVFKFLDPDSISITLVTSDAHKLGVMHRGRMRHITPRECARIQGYPDTFQHHPVDVHAYRQFGNSVSVPVVKAVIVDLFTHNSLAELFQNKCPQSGNTQPMKVKSKRLRILNPKAVA